ncbi:MAG: hypothetical protein H6Q73_200 [Firmicutes bacterium]|nr:hypothetical protein [Bacillota bacterium]
MVNVRQANLDDVDYIGARMRGEDVEECLAIANMNGQDALFMSYASSCESWVAEVNGEIVCIYGVVKPNSLWMLFVCGIDQLPMSFFRESRIQLTSLLDRYGVLGNYTAANNTFILKWLTWLGFSIGPEEVYNGVSIRRFRKEAA